MKTRRVVFGLPFDYIPNYSAGQQLNGAGPLRAHRGCAGWVALLSLLVSCFLFLPHGAKRFSFSQRRVKQRETVDGGGVGGAGGGDRRGLP